MLPVDSRRRHVRHVLLVIGATQVFTQIYLITKGGPYGSTQSLMTYMYQQAFTNFAFGYAAALASLLAVVLFGFSAARDPHPAAAGRCRDSDDRDCWKRPRSSERTPRGHPVTAGPGLFGIRR